MLLLTAVFTALLPVGSLMAATVAIPGIQGNSYGFHITSLKEARFKSTIRQKYDFSCGSAAVATLLTYQYGYPVNEQTAFEQMYAHGNRQKISKEGFSLLDIKEYLQANGFEADGFEVPLEKLQQEHLPAIVLIDEKGYHHFVVIKGLRDKRVLIGDPARGTRTMPISQFDALWKNHLVFVIHNRRSLAVFNNPADWHVAPIAPLGLGIDRSGLSTLTLPKDGPDDLNL
ncbi:C39 family peptidase [Rhodanobacter sp. C01]|uniref:C39 family peptidase n=1 Tax=Rhodanobacter sp. C01 TaxID=1945856 RepID=UPI0020C36A6E|nr:C39 family peptidase [Rhodanobacter sp. C01]